ncbi:dapper homolog 3-like [Xyrichtys novacula]|uniref:Dapper homolog 3-like n=1 Tax=Xyrichtys novacula TaxID=13765 RepID=A0AAV1FU99_XYRNO|nr:dapper homolog 3-like [Xyrichtys novacula]
MFASFSLPMRAERSRNKERLEASLAGLCELELLKQRQEARVLSALCLGDSSGPGRPPWGALRSARCALDAPRGDAADEQHSGLQCTPWGIKASLEQQVAELNVNTEVKPSDPPADLEDTPLSPGEVLVAKHSRSFESIPHPGLPRSLSAPAGTGKMEAGDTRQEDPIKGFPTLDALVEMRVVDQSQEDFQQTQKVETYIIGLIQRRALPTRPSKPRTSLAHDTRAVTVVRQSSFCCKEEQHSPKQASVQDPSPPSQSLEETAPQPGLYIDQECNPGAGFTESPPPPYHHHHLHPSVQHQPGLYHKPRPTPMMNTSCSTMLDYPSFRVLQAQPDSSNSEPDSPQQYHSNPSPPAPSTPLQPPLPDEQLVNAEYIPAQPCRASTRAYAHHHSNPNKGSVLHKPNRSTYSPERGHHHHHHHHHHQEQPPAASQIQPSRSRGGPKKCRSNEDKSGASRKPGKKACRSQSENSLQRNQERKYNTVERDGGGSGSGGRGSRGSQSKSKKQQQHGGGNYRRWQSTQELSQDEADQTPVQAPVQVPSASNQREHCGRRARKSRPAHAPYAYQHHHHSHHHQHMEYLLERDPVPLCPQPSEDYPHQGQGETESSMSEADSPDSSSLSSDSDESGGLVWPQQLPPQLSHPSPAAPSGASLQPKAFVKIKASHALKKKILRFRTGSLKVMTTV